MNKEQMTAIYECNTDWVKRAIITYHREKAGFNYSNKYFDTVVNIHVDGATIIVTDNNIPKVKPSTVVFNQIWDFLRLCQRKVKERRALNSY